MFTIASFFNAIFCCLLSPDNISLFKSKCYDIRIAVSYSLTASEDPPNEPASTDFLAIGETLLTECVVLKS